MAAELERRIEALEALHTEGEAAAPRTDRELLAIVAPDYTGPMPSKAEMGVLIHAWLTRPGQAEPPPADGLSAQERYMRMLKGPINGGAHGNA